MEWRARQQEAALSIDGREDKLGAIYEEIECEMELIGVTAIEDKLQDGVPQTIANLQMAGIKIWVLTGDKQETAVNIGYSCQLLTDDLLDLFIVDGSSQDEVEKQLRKYRESIKIVNTFSPGEPDTRDSPIFNRYIIIKHCRISVTSGDNSNLSVPYNQNNNGALLGSANTARSDSIDNATTASVPPAISVVTFRWDTISNIDDDLSAADR